MRRKIVDEKDEDNRKFKSCGHQVGQKCCCKFNYTAGHSFDLVDEINQGRFMPNENGR